MRFLRKGAALLLAASLCILSACGGDTPAPDNETAMGRYIEERWELPMDAVNVSVLTLRPDGRIFAVMNDMGVNGDGGDITIKGFSTSDGKDWQEDTPAWLQTVLDRSGWLYDMSYGKNGECFLIYDVIEGESFHRRVAEVTSDGVLRDIDGEWEKSVLDSYTIANTAATSEAEESDTESSEPVDEALPSDMPDETDGASEEQEADEANEADVRSLFYPSGIIVGDDGDIYIVQHFVISRFDTQGRFKGNIESYYAKFAYYNSGIAALSLGSVRGDTDTLKLYDADTGEERQDLNLGTLQSAQQSSRIATGPDDALYLANRNGIYRLVVGGTIWERIADGDLCSLSVPSMGIDGFIPHGDNEFLTMTSEQDKPALINYVYSAETPTRPDTELTVASLRKNSTLLQATGEFRRQHPEVLVTIQTLLEEDGSATTADAVRALNTQLLAGKGPDLLLLDGLPLNAYIEKGVLADMSDLLAPIIERELVPNIAGAFERDGKLYAVPARFNMPTIWGRPEAVSAASSLESIVTYAEANKNRKLFYAMDRKSLFEYFYATSAVSWLGESGKLDEAGFTAYLELIGRLADTLPGAAAKQDEVRTSPGFSITGIDTGGAVEVAYGKASLFRAELFGFDSLIIPNGAISALNGVVISADSTSVEDSLFPSHIALLPGQASGVFLPGRVIGINAAGKQQELAREFVQTILGETVQYSDLQDGFPVNKAAAERNILRRDDQYMSFGGEDKETGESYYLEMSWPSQGVFRTVCGLFDKLNTPYMPDDTLMEMIRSETEAFFSGSLSARETAAAVSVRLELYLAEQG